MVNHVVKILPSALLLLKKERLSALQIMPAKITIVPTSHIASESIRLIRDVIEEENPDCIAVELDANRYRALKEGEGSMIDALRALGPVTFAFYMLLRTMQQSLGRIAGVSPGSEMQEAVSIGQGKGVRVEYIDRDIGETFMRIKAVPAREKVKLLTFAARSLLPGRSQSIKDAQANLRLEGDDRSPSLQNLDLSKVPPESVVDAAIELLRKEFPWLYRILVEERNRYMAQRILMLSQTCQNIVAVVGAGHAKGIREILQKHREPSVSYSFSAE